MNRDEQAIFNELTRRKKELPPGWICEAAWPWRECTHLVAPKRKGGVIVKKWEVFVQLPGDGTVADTIEIGRDFKGRGWLGKVVEAALLAAKTHAHRFPRPALKNRTMRIKTAIRPEKKIGHPRG